MEKQLNNFPLRRSARIQQRQGSCLGGLQSTLVETESDMDCGGPSVDPELWCSCRGRDDGRLMICCDQQGENCNVWYHYDCLGLTMEESRRIGASGEGFVCPSCCLIQNNSHDASFIVDTLCLLDSCTDFQWGEISGQTFCNFILSAYEEVVHWRINIFWFHLGRLGRVLCLNLLDYIKHLQEIQLSVPLL